MLQKIDDGSSDDHKYLHDHLLEYHSKAVHNHPHTHSEKKTLKRDSTSDHHNPYNHYGSGGDGSHQHPHSHLPEQQHEIGEPKNPDRPVQNYFFEEEFFLNPLDYDYTETNPRSQADDVNIDIDLAWA